MIRQLIAAWRLAGKIWAEIDEPGEFWAWMQRAEVEARTTSKHIRIIVKVPLPADHVRCLAASQHRSEAQLKRRMDEAGA